MNQLRFSSDDGCRNQLDWSAFAYVSGELSPNEAEAFELRLEYDHTAREAVARAVELMQVVAAAEAHLPAQRVLLPPRAIPTWTARLSWVAIGGAAAIALTLVVAPWWRADDVAEHLPPAVESELATAWSATREELAQSDFGLWYLGRADSSGEGNFDDDPADLLTEAPGWMTAGVYGLAGLESPPSASDGDAATDGAIDELPSEPFTSERGDN
jgi:hypothetical protein